jgi:S-adenosylmethionine:diacylglycerol 3-amino-3-carboxypropyl transferase
MRHDPGASVVHLRSFYRKYLRRKFAIFLNDFSLKNGYFAPQVFTRWYIHSEAPKKKAYSKVSL